jgi:uncharacterized protein
MTGYNKPLPSPSADSLPFWEGCRNGKLLAQRCSGCGRLRFPPSAVCPNCLSLDCGWEEMSGRGKVFSFTVYRRLYHPGFAAEMPYVVALVALDEGPRLLSNVINIDPETVRCDMPVQVVFDAVTPEVTLPKFEPVKRMATQK